MSLADDRGASNSVGTDIDASQAVVPAGSNAAATWAVDKDAVYANGNGRPSMLPPNGKGIPARLKAKDNWVAWQVRVATGGTRFTKVPLAFNHVSMKGYGLAESDNRGTWVSWETARHRWNNFRDIEAFRVDGIGFMFGPGNVSDGFVGIDIDKCRRPDTGELSMLAIRAMDMLPGYWEVSPSGTGIKGIFEGTLPEGWKAHKVRGLEGGQEIEVYDRGRYFAVTGHRLAAAEADVMPCGLCLERFLNAHFPKEKTKRGEKASAAKAISPKKAEGPKVTRALSDDQVIDFVTTRGKDPAKGASLWAGDTSSEGNDHSSADMALVSLLAFYCGGDVVQIDRLFRRSGLMRDKWDRVHFGDGRTYGEGTIEKALSGRTDYYSPKGGGRRRVDERAESPGPSIANRASAEGEDAIRESATDPHRLAAVFLHEYVHGDRSRLLHYGDEWFEWRGGRYMRVEDSILLAQLTATLRSEFERLNVDELAAWEEGGCNGKMPTVRSVTRSLLANVLNAVKSLAIIPAEVAPPCWLGDDPGRCRPEELVACHNGLLVLPDLASGVADSLLPATPLFFNRTIVPLRFDPAAAPPAEWLQFLAGVFVDDPESVETLQEWFGYCLTADTSQQKALMMIGPRRSGKGTICRVLKGLMGKGNYASLNLVQLAEPFGLEPLASKTLAIVEDCRISDKNAADTKIVEQLLTIIGEGDSSVNRKNKSIIDATLRCRFTLCSNEAPRLKDSSLALPGRLIMLRLFKSFFGKEDLSLWSEKLKPELPQIFRWAVTGWARLKSRGYFRQPKSANALVSLMEAMSSPVHKFVEDRCAIVADGRVEKNALYTAFKEWCKESEIKACSRETFGKELYAAVPGLDVFRPRESEGGDGRDKRPRYYTGIALAQEDNEAECAGTAFGPPGPRADNELHWTDRDYSDDD